MDTSRASETMLSVLMIHIDFLLCYFEFAEGLIASLFALFLTFLKRVVFFHDDPRELIIECTI